MESPWCIWRVGVVAVVGICCAAPSLSAQDATTFEPPPTIPVHVSAYLTQSRVDPHDSFMYGVQIELAHRAPVYPFGGFLRGKVTKLFEAGVGAGMHVGKPRVFGGLSLAVMAKLNDRALGMRAGVDVPLIEDMGVRLEARHYSNGYGWVYALAATAPPFRRHKARPKPRD